MSRAIGRRMIVTGVLLAVLVGGSFAALLFAIRDLGASTNAVRAQQEVLLAANSLQQLVGNLETSLQDYVVTRDQRSLESWSKARAALPAQTAVVARLAHDQPKVQQYLLDITAGLNAYIADYGLPLLQAAGRDDASAQTFAVGVAGERRIEAIEHNIGSIRLANAGLLRIRQHDNDAAARNAVIAAVIGTVGSVLLLLLAFRYVTVVVVGPIRRAAQMSEQIAAGHLDARVPETGTGEIAALEKALNTMGDSLARSRDELDDLLGEQAALRRVATLVAEDTRPAEVFAAVSEEVGQLFESNTAVVFRFEDEPTLVVVGVSSDVATVIPVGTKFGIDEPLAAAEVYRTARSARVDTWNSAASSSTIGEAIGQLGVTSSVASPIVVDGHRWGAVSVGSKHPLPLDAGERLDRFTDLVATAIANAESSAELAASRRRIVAASDEARRRIERDLHDGTQQRLVSLGLATRAAAASVPAERGDLRAELEEVAAAMVEAAEELQELSRGIHPAIDSIGGLGPALRSLARRSAVPVELDVGTDARLSEPIEVAAYFVASEAMANTVKHAHASRIELGLTTVNNLLVLSIRDDGVGGADPATGSGLVGLSDRVEALGGSLEVRSRAGQGTRITAKLPVEVKMATSQESLDLTRTPVV